jgi:hypothetical protein
MNSVRSVWRDDPDRFMTACFAVLTVGAVAADLAYALVRSGMHTGVRVVVLVTLALALVLVIGLLRRRSVAWWILLAGGVIDLVFWSRAHLRHGITSTFVPGFVIGLIELALLLSPQVRRYVGIGRREVRRPSDAANS